MSESWVRKRTGQVLVGLGMAGIAAQVYLFQKMRQSIEYLHQNIVVNPSLEEYREMVKGKNQFELTWVSFFFGSNFFVYLNGPLEPLTDQIVKDSDFGYSIYCIALMRKVDKLQWGCEENGEIVEKWAEGPENSLKLPEGYRSTPWVLNTDFFRSGKTCGLRTFQVRIKDLLPYLLFQPCYYTQDIISHNFFDLKKQKTQFLDSRLNSKNFLLTKKTFSSRIKHFCLNELKDFSVTPQHLTLSTKDNGTYQVSYMMAPTSQRVSIIGKVLNNKIFPFCEVFLEHGDVDAEVMIERIQKKFNWNATFWLISAVFLGFSLSY